MSISQHHLIFFLLYIHLATTLSTNKTKIPSCPSVDCGNGVNISYPFWVSNPTSNSFCGYEGLEVTCKNKIPTLRALSDNYTITKLDTDKKIVSLTDTDVVDKPCPRVQHQFNLRNTPILNYASGVTNLTFFFNCSTSVLPDANLASCLAEEAGRSYVLIGPVPSDTSNTLSGDCNGGVVVSPVLVDNTDRNKLASMFPEALKGGFELAWKAPETVECRDCEGRDGYCGYRNKTGNGIEFTCLCSNGSMNCKEKPKAGISLKAIIIIVVAISFLGAIVFAGILLKKKKTEINAYKEDKSSDSESLVGTEFQLMGIEIAQEATNNFAKTNKLGEGGFGPVYKGLLADGTEVAIKRLSHSSSQGSEEFKNEVKLIAKLQHKNLVKLLGCCVEGGEKLLIYEYLPNGSLDVFLDDPDRRSQMDWTKRMKIILGVTKGLIYLHEDSQLKVVHRDMKPSNVLLDLSMNPKISDFGLARIFDGDDKEANTNRVVGTYGYMAPEFALAGIFSVKSDVFGFGVLLLEIISGQKNGRFYFLKNRQSLLKRAWHLWKEKKGEELVNELVDPSIAGTFPNSEAIRCIQIGLLCVQENATDRPKMSMVLRMFENEQMVLMEPHQPPSFTSEGEHAPPISFSDMPEFTSTTAPPMSFSDMPEFTSTNEITMVDVKVRGGGSGVKRAEAIV